MNKRLRLAGLFETRTYWPWLRHGMSQGECLLMKQLISFHEKTRRFVLLRGVFLLRTMADRKLHLPSSRLTKECASCMHSGWEDSAFSVCPDQPHQTCVRGVWMIRFVGAYFPQECQKMPAQLLFELNQSISQQESITGYAWGSAVSLSLD